MTPLLCPVWCRAISRSFSRRATWLPGARRRISRAVASPTMPPPMTATSYRPRPVAGGAVPPTGRCGSSITELPSSQGVLLLIERTLDGVRVSGTNPAVFASPVPNDRRVPTMNLRQVSAFLAAFLVAIAAHSAGAQAPAPGGAPGTGALGSGAPGTGALGSGIDGQGRGNLGAGEIGNYD